VLFADTPQDFSGEWIVANKEQQARSADGKGVNPGSRHGGNMSGAGHAGGMGGMGGGHGGMGGGRHRPTGAAADSSANGVAAGGPGDPRVRAQALTIRQSEVVFDIAADGGNRTVYRFDNRNNYGPIYGGTVNLTWAAPEMVIETHPDGGGSIEEHYILSADGRKLTLRVHEQAAGTETSRDLTRVFVRSGSQDDAAASKLP
jgi:hypothetical protein